MLYKLISCAQYEWEFEGCSWAFFFLVTQLEWNLRRSEMMSDQHLGLLCASEGRLQGHKLRPFIFQAKRKERALLPSVGSQDAGHNRRAASSFHTVPPCSPVPWEAAWTLSALSH